VVTAVSDDMEAILFGSVERGLVSHVDRSVLVIGRIDRAPVSPHRSRAAFERHRSQKAGELRAVIDSIASRQGVEADGLPVLCVAADPAQKIGHADTLDPAESFEESRPWDGVGYLRELVLAARDSVNPIAPDISALGGGIARLSGWAGELLTESADLHASSDEVERLITETGRLSEFGRALRDDRRELLRRRFSDRAVGLVNEALAVPVEHLHTVLASELENLNKDAALGLILEEWQQETAAAVTQWSSDVRTSLGARIDRKAFQRAVETALPRIAIDADALRPNAVKAGLDNAKTFLGPFAGVLRLVGRTGLAEGGSTAATAGADVAGAMTRAGSAAAAEGASAVGATAAKVGAEAAKAGAEAGKVSAKIASAGGNTAKMLGRLGLGIQLVVAGVDGIQLFYDVRRAGKREQAFRELMTKVQKAAGDAAAEVADASGAFHHLSERLAELDHVGTDLQSVAATTAADAAEVDRRHAKCAELIDLARQLLNQETEELR
jgi:hypothetical protein